MATTFSFQDDGGQTHVIPEFSDFTTTVQRIDTLEESAAADDAPIGSFVAVAVQHRYSDLAGLSNEQLARWAISRTVVADPAPPIPNSVSRASMKVALYRAGKLADVEQAVTAAGGEALIWWQEIDHFDRDKGMLLGIATQLGMSTADVDNLFRAAAAI